MERERKLGWIAIAIGTVALLVALSSQFSLWRMQHGMMAGRMGGMHAQFQQNDQGGRGWKNPQGQGQQAQPGGRGWQHPQAPAQPDESGQFQAQQYGPRGGGFFGRGPFGGFGLFKLGMLAALFKLGLLALAIFLVVKWLNKRRQPAAAPVAPAAPAAAAPPSEEPPYTNETRNL
ncbi:hypothetical protein F8S13_23650 [Chloroflexia bacterium SDU3-3]|nr:hypothetical protein F8S13_23650 [Chloroflexia bacterium SDU3-3]